MKSPCLGTQQPRYCYALKNRGLSHLKLANDYRVWIWPCSRLSRAIAMLESLAGAPKTWRICGLLARILPWLHAQP
jgi:hypothetical protein